MAFLYFEHKSEVKKKSDDPYLHQSGSEKVKKGHLSKFTKNSHVIHQNKDLGERKTNPPIKTV